MGNEIHLLESAPLDSASAARGAAVSATSHWTPAQKNQDRGRPTDEGLVRREDRLVQSCAARMEQAMQTSPDWFAYFEDVQAMSASRADVLELLRCAPDEFTRGLMYGIYLMRSELALVTGREFD